MKKLWLIALLFLPVLSVAQEQYPGQQRDLEVARRYAPVFYQRLAGGDFPRRFDYITNFDFDGDWAGNNNWENAANARFLMRAYVYYAVVETERHYFITYATFHPRDWSAVQPLLGGVLDSIQKSDKYGQYLPPELRRQLELNHENDMEGAQLVVRKAGSHGPERLETLETLAHDSFHAYYPADSSLTPAAGATHSSHGALEFEGARPLLYVEAQKHGVHAWPYEPGHGVGSIFDSPDGPLLIYRYKGVAEDPDKVKDDQVGYDLLPLYSTFWKRARGLENPNLTFGEIHDFGDLICRHIGASLPSRATPAACKLGRLGTALRGDYAGKNKAVLPWGWDRFSNPLSAGDVVLRSGATPGDWFLNPARVMRLRYPEAPFSEIYVSNPFLGVFR